MPSRVKERVLSLAGTSTQPLGVIASQTMLTE